MRRNDLNSILAAAAVFGLGLAACEPQADQPAEEPAAETAPPAAEPGAAAPTLPQAELPAGVTQDMVAQGQQIFAGPGLCYTCHAMDATGTQLAPDLTDQEWLNVTGEYEEIVQVITTGVPQPVQHPAPMPPKGGSQITDEQVRSVAAYIYALSHGG